MADSSPRSIIVIFVTILVIIGITWRGCWYGAPLSDKQITSFLSGEGSLNDMQKALAQVEKKIQEHPGSAKSFYPLVANLVIHEAPKIRSTTAWVMGMDPKHEPFGVGLRTLLRDQEPLVQRNAALGLVRRGSDDGLDIVRSMLADYVVRAPAGGDLVAVLSRKETVRVGTKLARIREDNGTATDIASPLDGTVRKVEALIGKRIEEGAEVLRIAPTDPEIANAVAALRFIGTMEDIALVQRVLNGELKTATAETVQIAKQTLEVLRKRHVEGK